MPSWDWWDAWKSGDTDAFKRDQAFAADLAAETDRSLARDPDRRPWGKKVEDTVEEPTRTPRWRGGGHGKHGRGGQGGEQAPHGWSDREWANARKDYQRQNANYLRELDRDAAEERRSLRDIARERRQAAREVRDQLREQERQARDDYRRGTPPPGYKDW